MWWGSFPIYAGPFGFIVSDMTNTPKKAPSRKSNKEDPSRRRLLRSPDERMFAGVAGGVASYLGVDPTFVRLGFAAAALFGGLGILAYLVMAVSSPWTTARATPFRGRPPTWAIVLLAIAALIILPGPFFGFGDGWFFGIGFLWLIALVWPAPWPTGPSGAQAAVRFARRLAGTPAS